MIEAKRAALRELGYELGERAPGGLSGGAWFATSAEGAPVVLKWSPAADALARYQRLLPALEELRARGLPVPRYAQVLPFAGGTLAAQTRLPGRSQDNPSPQALAELAELLTRKDDLAGPPPAADPPRWGAFVVGALRAGRDGLATHEPLRAWSPRSARVLERVLAVGAAADPARFPAGGLVHLDLHTDNVLIEGQRISGIIDWEGACAGDPRYDLVQFVFDLDGHDQPAWEWVEALDLEPEVLRAYVALLVLKCTASALRHRPEDAPRQLARAERVLQRCGA